MGNLARFFLLLILFGSCSKRVVTTTTDSRVDVHVRKVQVPETTIHTKPTFEPLVITRILNQHDTVKITQWKTQHDTIVTMIDCPDIVTADTTKTITNTKTVTKEKTGLGKLISNLKIYFWIVAGIAFLILIVRLFKR